MIIQLNLTDAEADTLAKEAKRQTTQVPGLSATLFDLYKQIAHAITMARSSVSPYRQPGLVKGGSESDDLNWVDDAKAATDLARIDSTASVATRLSLLKSLERRNDELSAELETLKDRRQLKAENERLRMELTAVGPPEAHEEIELYRKKCVTAEEDLDVMRRQRNALAEALRSERIDRQRLEERSNAQLDPCRQGEASVALILEAEATIQEQRNAARLTGNLERFDAALRERGLDPEAEGRKGRDE